MSDPMRDAEHTQIVKSPSNISAERAELSRCESGTYEDRCRMPAQERGYKRDSAMFVTPIVSTRRTSSRKMGSRR